MHRFIRLLTALAPALLAFSLFQAPAMAATESGTHAWSNHQLVLRDGPSTAYTVTGQIESELAIKVLRCQKLWCLVDGDTGRGWTHKHNISFGRQPEPLPFGNNPNYPMLGTACFYSGTNFTGTEFCVSTGRVIQDLALLGIDNGFASVRLDSTSVSVCRDRFFQSYCERIVTSQPVLDRYLRGALSSIRVH